MNEYTYTEAQVNRMLALLGFSADNKGLQRVSALLEIEQILRSFKKTDEREVE